MAYICVWLYIFWDVSRSSDLEETDFEIHKPKLHRGQMGLVVLVDHHVKVHELDRLGQPRPVIGSNVDQL